MREFTIKNPLVSRIARILGGVPATAARLNITRTAIYAWKQVPSGRVLAIEAATEAAGEKVSRHEMRPDLYPLEESRSAAE